MLTSAPMPAALAAPSRPRLLPIGLAAIGLAAIVALGLALGGEALAFVASGLPAFALVSIAALARLGSERRWARVATLVVGGTTIAAIGLIFFATSAIPLVQPAASGAPALAPGVPLKLLLLLVGLTAGGLLGLLGLIPPWRRALASRLPFDPASFPAGVGLAGVLAATAMAAVPLLVLSAPPLLAMLASTRGAAGAAGEAGGQLRQEVYSLLWLLPGVVVAAGWGLGRSRADALARLGLVRPTGRQLTGALGAAGGLAVAAYALELATAWLWAAMGWPRTDSAWMSQLFGFALSPAGLIVVGVTAGLGEELLLRGLLQPRVGLLLANLCFASIHALQYNWDGVLQVFLVGIVFGLIRRRANTTTSAVAHGAYDVLALLPGLLAGG